MHTLHVYVFRCAYISIPVAEAAAVETMAVEAAAAAAVLVLEATAGWWINSA